MSLERAEAVQAYNLAMLAFVNAQAAVMANVFAGASYDIDHRDARITALEAAEYALEGAEQLLERHAH